MSHGRELTNLVNLWGLISSGASQSLPQTINFLRVRKGLILTKKRYMYCALPFVGQTFYNRMSWLAMWAWTWVVKTKRRKQQLSLFRVTCFFFMIPHTVLFVWTCISPARWFYCEFNSGNVHWMFTLGARKLWPSTIGSNVNTLFFQVLTPEFAHGSRARVQCMENPLSEHNYYMFQLTSNPGLTLNGFLTTLNLAWARETIKTPALGQQST